MKHYPVTYSLIVFLAFFAFNPLSAQNALVEGYVNEEGTIPMELVMVSVQGTTYGTTTNKEGYFSLKVPPGDSLTLSFSFIGFKTETFEVFLRSGESLILNVNLAISATALPSVEVVDRQIISSQYIKLDPELAALLPGPGSGVEALLKTLPGVSSSSELSSQYSVRGGNFDENLVYVNGIEIYRPFLVRSGQQEGLSFINSDLVSSITFSAGGFDAKYGDKMASVLDITYRQPEGFAGSTSLSLLEGSLHLEDAINNTGISYLLGIRHKSNQYLLGTLDTQGDYQPMFTDVQALVMYDFTDSWSLSALGNFSRNQYLFVPEKQETRFGTVTEVRQLTVHFNGQEANQFFTATGALALDYEPYDELNLRWIASVFQTDETENFDILGQYVLERVETDFGDDNFGQPTGTPLGVGSFLHHARNYLNAIVWNAEHRGKYAWSSQEIQWGAKFQQEDIFDRLSEWTMIDSAGYSLPRHPQHAIILQDTVNTRIYLKSQRYSGFVQHSSEFDRIHGRFIFTMGLRSNYWNFNNQNLLSPRATLLYKPEWAPRMVFRASAGLYKQPAFYRELRDFQGNLNENIKAQESLQLVLGAEYNLFLWDRPFKYVSEAYYKHFNNLIPYQIDNVRIRYFANNNATGYAAGLDMKINGEFVPGVESWASLSIMKTEEVIEGEFLEDENGNLIPAGYIPRPTDQRFNFSMFFQDFLPRNPTYKVQLGFVYGSGLPFGPPGLEKQKDTLRMPPYRRVDIGFSKELIGVGSSFRENNPLRHINSMWLTLEVFNLLEINNTISYLWITDVENRQFAVPNFLTRRLINVKLITRF